MLRATHIVQVSKVQSIVSISCADPQDPPQKAIQGFRQCACVLCALHSTIHQNWDKPGTMPGICSAAVCIGWTHWEFAVPIETPGPMQPNNDKQTAPA